MAAGSWKSVWALVMGASTLVVACRREASSPAATPAPRPWILLVTLDTTRADSIGPEAAGIETPAFNALATRGRRFRHAYTTVPETLPAHASMMTGLLPAGHGVHQNARPIAPSHPVLAETLRASGYRTAALVSSFVLARRFGLARGFDFYDDEMPGGAAERRAAETTERALSTIARHDGGPLFLWVHYFDPHAPYAPPEPFRARFRERPYLGEVAAVDEQLGRLVRAFDHRAGATAAILVAADHGEGLGDHGEAQHGNLLYESAMRVPMVVIGPGIAPGVVQTPVSTRRLFHTILDFAGQGGAQSLRGDESEIVLGEGMKPFLAYGWQPQVMAVEGRLKAIRAGTVEVYDLVDDPGETRDLGPDAPLSREIRTAVREYPIPSVEETAAVTLGEAERRQLASLGYVSAGAAPLVRKDAPRPAAMAHIFDLLDKASGLFVREEYAAVIPLLRRILAADPHNLDAALRLGTAHSALGQGAQAEAAFEKAASLAPQSRDVRLYRALHHARGPTWSRAVPELERAIAETPERLPALEALAAIRARQGRVEEAIALRQKVHELRAPSAADLVTLAELAMETGRTDLATESLERARAMQGTAFAHDLELGVLYLAARRLPEARDALDRVPPSHRGYAMALFKRAQVSVLLREPDSAARIARARERADRVTRPLIENERLFRH